MNSNKHSLCALGAAVSMLVGTAAFAQGDASSKGRCYAVGEGAMEPLGDRDGHAVSVSEVVCHIEGGPLSGGVLTGTTIYEWDKGTAMALSGGGVIRKAGAMAAYVGTEAKFAPTMTDGKVTGSAGSGRGRYTLATGTAASLQGKTFSYTFKSSGPGMVSLEVKVD